MITVPRELSDFVKGGLSLLIKGGSGCGKTTLALSLLEELGGGFYISTRVSAEKLKLHFPWVGSNVKVVDATNPSIPKRAPSIVIRYLTAPQFLQALYSELSRHSAHRVVVIDSIEALRAHLSEEDRLEKTVLEVCESAGASAVFVSECTGETTLDYMVDGIVQLRRESLDGRVLRVMDIHKLRGKAIEKPSYVFTLHQGEFRALQDFQPHVEGVCNAICSNCPSYRESCLGCIEANKASDSKCPIYECAMQLKVAGCKLCPREDECTLLPEVSRPGLKLRPGVWKPIQNSVLYYSTGVEDLDRMLGGGYPRGSICTLDLGEELPGGVLELLARPTICNFLMQGDGVVSVPVGWRSPKQLAKYVKPYVSKDRFNRLYRVVRYRGAAEGRLEPYEVTLPSDRPEDFARELIAVAEELRKVTGGVRVGVGICSLAERFGVRGATSMLEKLAIYARQSSALVQCSAMGCTAELEKTLKRLSSVYLKARMTCGTVLLYGEKPRTELYVLEVDASLGYPVPKLTPVQ